MVGRHQTWHVITALRQHTRSDYVGRGMTSPALDSTHGRTTFGVTCHHVFWTAHTVERRWAWHSIITFGQHKRSDGVGRGIPLAPLDGKPVERRQAWNAIISFRQYAWSTSSDVACHHGHWTPHTIERSRSSHAIITLGLADTIGNDGRGMTCPLLDSTHGRTKSDMACHHRPWAAHTVGLCLAWHDITSLGQHTRLNDVVHGMPSSPFGSTHSRMTSGVAYNHSS